MFSIYFVSTYKPILCGIADYLKFLLKEVSPARWKVISFNLKNYIASGDRLTKEKKESPKQVWYGITNRRSPSFKEILKGIKKLAKKDEKFVLWFQHTFGIWKNSRAFAKCLKELNKLKIPIVVTLHTLHFQSEHTIFGLEERKKNEYDFLKLIFPYVSAVTVFSRGCYSAIKKAFPEYISKTFIIRHGIHFFREIIKMPKEAARKKIYQFLINKSNLPRKQKAEIKKEDIFGGQDILLLGQAGFVVRHKNAEKLFLMRDLLQEIVPEKKVVAIYIGVPRENEKNKIKYALKLRGFHNGKNKFFLETWLPEEFLSQFQRALDINFYWPRKCTQSGIISHILGTGSLIAGRNMEGSGEMLKEAGQIVDKDFENLIFKIKKVISSPSLLKKIEEKSIKYAKKYSWENQALKHYQLAERIVSS